MGIYFQISDCQPQSKPISLPSHEILGIIKLSGKNISTIVDKNFPVNANYLLIIRAFALSDAERKKK